MKSLVQYFAIVFGAVLVMASAGCSKESSKNNDNNQHRGGYYLSNGQCYSSANNQPVAMTYCQNNGGNNGYYWYNGACYSSTTNQPVANTYCQNNGGNNGYYWYNGACYSSTTNQPVANTYCQNNTGGGGLSTQCVGVYYWMSWYGIQAVYCNGSDCRGYTLYNQQGQSVRCL